MANYTQRSRRSNRGNRTNKILNILIGIVLVLIIITVSFIFVDGGDQADDKASKSETESVETDDSIDKDNPDGEEAQNEEASTETPNDEDASDGSVEEEQQDAEDGEEAENNDTATMPDDSQAIEQPSDDPVVDTTITNPSWKPIGTSQSGTHVSSYDEDSVDWAEKERALSYATGLSQDNMIIWFLGNGGSPQKSIGTVSSKDQTQKYRVYLQWVDGEGWKPEKMDVLNTLEGAKP